MQSSHIWMLENRIHTIFQVHSESAALTVKAKEKGGGRENKGAKERTVGNIRF